MPSKKTSKKKQYAYFVPSSGKQGVADSWPVVEKMVKGVTGARYKAFDSKSEAERWLANGAKYEVRPQTSNFPATHSPLSAGIYFDAGTGRGDGVEISVTDETGRDLLHEMIKKGDLNKFGKHLLEKTATNNYGELLALWYALGIAKKFKINKIFGDSRLVIDYWSQYRIKRKELPAETVQLADKVAALREEFEENGGTIERISGAKNPADLGFH